MNQSTCGNTYGDNTADLAYGQGTYLGRIEYKVSKDILTFASVTTGFHSPAIGDGGATTKPEKPTSYELGFQSGPLDRQLSLLESQVVNNTLERAILAARQSLHARAVRQQRHAQGSEVGAPCQPKQQIWAAYYNNPRTLGARVLKNRGQFCQSHTGSCTNGRTDPGWVPFHRRIGDAQKTPFAREALPALRPPVHVAQKVGARLG